MLVGRNSNVGIAKVQKFKPKSKQKKKNGLGYIELENGNRRTKNSTSCKRKLSKHAV